MKKARNRVVNADFLKHRAAVALEKGYTKARWIMFCEILIEKGFECSLYEARRTVSKYITVRVPGVHNKSYKVRFSNHKPIKHREAAGDCDFFVGITNLGITNSAQAINAVLDYFREEIQHENFK